MFCSYFIFDGSPDLKIGVIEDIFQILGKILSFIERLNNRKTGYIIEW